MIRTLDWPRALVTAGTFVLAGITLFVWADAAGRTRIPITIPYEGELFPVLWGVVGVAVLGALSLLLWLQDRRRRHAETGRRCDGCGQHNRMEVRFCIHCGTAGHQ